MSERDIWRDNVSGKAALAHDRLTTSAEKARSQSRKESKRGYALSAGAVGATAAGGYGAWRSLKDGDRRKIKDGGTLADKAKVLRNSSRFKGKFVPLALGGAATGALLNGAGMGQHISSEESKKKAYRRDAIAGKIRRTGEKRAKEAGTVGKAYLEARVAKSLSKSWMRYGASSAAGDKSRTARQASTAVRDNMEVARNRAKRNRDVSTGLSVTPGGPKKYDPSAAQSGRRRGPGRAVDNPKGYQPGLSTDEKRRKMLMYGGLGAGAGAGGLGVGYLAGRD